MATRNFNQKVIVITGASGNLGTELCLKFGKEGAYIVGLDISEAALEHLSNLLKQHNIRHWTSLCDITNLANIQEVINTIIEKFGQLDVWINNAGITHIQRFLNTAAPDQITRKIMEVNFFGAIQSVQIALPFLIKTKGLIVNISSVAGFAPLVGRTAYSSSKHALHGFFESLREELYEKEVGVLMVCPSYIGQSAAAYNGHSDAQSIHQPKKILGNLLVPEVLAGRIYVAAQNNKKLLVVGRTAWLSYWLRRLFPNWYARTMRKRLENEG